MERIDVEHWRGREVARLLALVETERRYYQEMLASLPVALAVLSSDNTIDSANRVFRDSFGVRPNEIRRRKIDQVFSSPEFLNKIKEAQQSTVQIPSLNLTLAEKLLRVAIVPFRNWDDTDEVETLLMISDISDLAPELQAAPKAQETAPTSVAPAEPHAGEIHPTPADAPASEHLTEAPAEPAHTTDFVIVNTELLDEEVAEPAVDPLTVDEPAEEAKPQPLAKPSPLQAEFMPAVLWLANANDLSFTHVSESAAPMFGYAAADWTANPRFFSLRIHVDDRDAILALYRAAVEHGQEVNAEFRMHNAAGNLVWCREIFRPLPTGSVSGVLTTVGARKQLEQQRVTQARHSALQNLSAQLAHDLNNPLMIITGYAEEMLHNTPQQDSRRGDLEEILVAAQRISGITSQLLNFTRKPEPAAHALDLAHMVFAVKQKADEIAGGSDMVYLNTNDPVWALAEYEPLERILLTLVKAVCESPGKKVAITVDTAVINEQLEAAPISPGTFARLTVRNDGHGMEPSKSAAIFESFVTKDRPTPSSPLGAELAHAYALIQSWGGDILFASDVSQGSAFTVYLPLTSAPAEPEAAHIAPHVPSESTHLATRETILVVDDEPGIRALVAKILRRERYDVIEAGSANEAISVAATHPNQVNLLLTDVMLPDRSGRQVAEQLSESLADLKVLYISGFTDDESVRAGEFPPGSRFLQKPFTVGALVGKVREALD